jgi:transcriptional regulator with XRE-family HTH domain
MTTERYERIPELTLGWRLKMSLGEVTRDEIARVMDVTPSTISRWMSDKGAPPKRPYLIQWALATGVPVEWLETGTSATSPPEGDPVTFQYPVLSAA